MIEPSVYEPHELDLGGCGHCDRPGAVTDCPACGEDRCAACASEPCRAPVACSCGRVVEGRRVHWTDDGEPYCDDCDPLTECDAGSRCGAVVRRHEIETVVLDGEGYGLCRECRGEEG